MSETRIGVYPGTFDPITKGHLDIIWRAARLVDRLIIGIAVNDGKGPCFSLEERMEMAREEVAAGPRDLRDRIEVHSFETLLTKFADAVGATIIIRGLRAVSDFEYEFQMAGMNARLNPGVETVFLMASDKHHFISSRFVKEIARLNGDVSGFVSPRVARYLKARFGEAGDGDDGG